MTIAARLAALERRVAEIAGQPRLPVGTDEERIQQAMAEMAARGQGRL